MSKVTIQKHLEAYEATPEEWKKGHDDAITCFDVQDSIAFGLLILELINETDEQVRTAIYSGKFSDELAAQLTARTENLSHKWLKASYAHLEAIATCQHKGYSIERADELQNAVGQIQKIITPDRDFFSSKRLVEMRDQAVGENVAGKTTEWEGRVNASKRLYIIR